MSDVFEDTMGIESNSTSLRYGSVDSVWKTITTSVDAHKPIGAGTYGEDQEAKYTNTGIYADHAYSILGYEKSGNDRFVVLRNPWGESEPAGNGANDGLFKLKLEEFTKLYQTLYFGQ
jgi:Calpain family cysteine protease